MFRPFLVSLEIARPHNMLAAALCVLAGFRVAGGRDLHGAWIAALFAAVATGAGNIVNDCFDLEIDRVNKPRRPLPSQRLSRRAAGWLYVASSAALVGGALWILPGALAVLVLVWQVALLVYAAAAKRMFLVGNVLVAAVTSSAFLAGALLAGEPRAALVPQAIAFVFVMSRELVKGAEDVEGDARQAVGTVAVVMGVKSALTAAAFTMLGLAVVLPIPALSRYYGRGYGWTMEALVAPGLLAGSALILHDHDRRTCNRVSWILKAGMFFGILAIGVARG